MSRAWLLRWRNPTLSQSKAELVYSRIKTSSDTANSVTLGHAARVLGWHDRWTGNFARANTYFLEAERLLISDDVRLQRIEAMAGRAVLLYSQGRQDSASDLIRQALEMLGFDGSISTRVDLFLVQATILSYSGAFDDALALVDDAITLASGGNHLSELAHAYHIHARILLRKGDVNPAWAPARKAVRLARRSRNAVVLPYTLEVMAAVKLEMGRFGRSHWLASQAADLGQSLNDRRVTCQALVIIGKALLSQGDQDGALEVQRRGLRIAKEIAYPLWQRWFQLEIASIMEARGDYRAALPAYKAYAELDQSLFRMETEARMAEMRVKFDVQRAQELAEVERARGEELEKAQQIAEIAARSDQLTGIANRTGLEEYKKRLAQADAGVHYAYVAIDLNRFKPINDTFGHAAGDCVLAFVAKQLREVVRKGDIVARTGGDEFALIVQGIATREQAKNLGQRILTVFEHPARFDGRAIDISGSIGIATTQALGMDMDKLMMAADQAMFTAKDARKSAYRIHDTLKADAATDLNRMKEIRLAIAHGEIQPWYQPQVDLRSGDFVGFEALARWRKPTGEVIMPGAFLPQLQSHRLGSEFTYAMLRQTLQQMARWKAAGHQVPKVSVNIVEEVLASRDARAIIEAILDDFAEFRSMLTFEITEDVLFDRGATEIRESIQRLSLRGTRFAMDDFGTGFGSFTRLHQLHMDELKIDTTFVHGIGHDRAAETIIEGFIFIAKGLRLEVIAEGIETPEQEAFLRARGCDFGQGFLFGKAIPPTEAVGYLVSERPTRTGAV
ncbi:putative bifunctional diguanylate cyclase/phosphodiesterase [Yoonia sp. R2331]|uniref:putative bifunctional diguanylate cyclase/phosphodiesterase n=1 Tax=Yoonia sp. R2331 TaxID=3237238 RepID=UPI0034E4E15F